MRFIVVACAALALIGCTTKTNAPELPQVTAPESVIDDPTLTAGMVEPRVSLVSIAPVDVVAPPFSAKAEVVFFPDSTRRVSEVRELMLRLNVTGLAKPTDLTLELTQPGGMPYEARATNIGRSPFETYSAEFVFPVAGTSIDRANLSGTWTARYVLGGEVVTEGTFELEP